MDAPIPDLLIVFNNNNNNNNNNNAGLPPPAANTGAPAKTKGNASSRQKCPSCKKRISTKSKSLVRHLTKCNNKMANELYPDECKKLEANKLKLTLRKLNKHDTLGFDGGIYPGAAFLSNVEVNEKDNSCHGITLTSSERTEFTGYMPTDTENAQKRKCKVDDSSLGVSS
jgi:hypothetical protein